MEREIDNDVREDGDATPGLALELATRVADGETISWEEARRRAAEIGPDMLRSIEFVERVVQAHQSLHGQARKRTTWGQLELGDEIGRGSFGAVYRARDPLLERSVALKLLPATTPAPTLLTEGRRLARVRHTNVATVHSVEMHDNCVGLVMELVEGTHLADIVRASGPFGWREAAAIATDLCGALAAIHAAGLIHGDVKAQNVVRERGGRIVLLDLGASLEQRATDGPRLGTPLYLAPEVLEGVRPTPASDLYSLGVLLYFLVAGRFPYEAPDPFSLRAVQAAGAIRDLRDARPDLPKPFVEVVMRALARDPAQRYQGAGEMERALSALGDPSPRRVRGARTALAGAVLALIALIVAGWRIAVPVAAPANAPVAAGLATGPGALQVRATLWRAGVVADEPLADGARVAPGDRLFLDVESGRAVHLYVFNVDRAGHGYLLHPGPEAESGTLAAGTRHRLPQGAGAERAFWEVSSRGGRESIVVVAAPQRIPVLEDALALLVPVDDERFTAVASARLRGIGRVHREPLADSSVAGRLSDALRRVRETAGDELFVQEVVLDNPEE